MQHARERVENKDDLVGLGRGRSRPGGAGTGAGQTEHRVGFCETTYGMPRVYNLLRDPQERENVLFPNTWVPKAALAQLVEHAASLQAHPPIKPGALDPYEPSQ